jgi:transposase
VWAWLLDSNRQRHQRGERLVTGYQALCRELTSVGSFGELSTVGARSVLQRYSDAWFQAAKRRDQPQAGFPRRKRTLVPVRFYHGTFSIQGQRVRLPVAKGQPALWVRLSRPLPYPVEAVRAVTLLAGGGRLWLAVTAAVPVQQRDADTGRVAGVDLGIIHPYALVTEESGLLVSGRAIRAESYLHLKDQQARHARAARRRPKHSSAARAAGVVIESGFGVPRRGIAAASTTPSIRPPSRPSPSPSGTRSAPLLWATPKASPRRMRGECRTGGCGSGAAPTSCRRCATRPNWQGLSCG